MGNGISVCSYGKDKEEAARVLYPTLKALGYKILPDQFPGGNPDLDSLIILIEGYGNYQMVFPPIDAELGVVKAAVVYISS